MIFSGNAHSRQAEALKATVSDNSKNVSEVCVSRQRMEDLYKKVLLMDLEYALDKKVEQELWNHAFKNQINTLQAQAKDKQNPKRSEIQASLNLFLEMASGVYLQLLQLVCSTFKLDLPFRRKSSTYGIMKERSLGKMKINPPKKSSCLYICQYCLVHLGDIARYRQQVDQAQSYYWHAAHLIPVNGQPYNQLAILEVARGNKLSTIFYYIRSLAVRHPFPATATNLEKFFSKISRERSEFRSKLSTTEFLTAFLQFHAFIHLCLELTRATDLSEKLLASMPAHVTSQSFSWHVLVQMLAINLFAMFHAARRSDASPDNSPHKEELSEDEERSYDIVFNFTVNTLEVLVTYTPKQEQKARGYFTMPAISVIMAWLRLDKDNFSKPVLRQSTLWPHLAKLFNAIQPLTTASMADSANRKGESDVALPEDFELRSFQPIEKAHSVLSFSQSVLEDRSPELMSTIRCQRLVNHGKWIAEQFPSLNLLNVKEEKPGRVIFSSATPMVKVLPAGTDTAPGEKKAVRQNVAIQAIIQKQKGTDNSPERSPANESSPQAKVSKDGRGDGKGDSHSPTKYLLGTPMKDPQFMKVSSGRSSGGNQTASSPSATTTRSPTVTFQLPPQQLSPKEKQHSEKPTLKMSTSGQSYQSRHNSANPPLGAQYRQMQHQQAMKQAKLQQQQQHLKQQQMQQQQQQKQQTWQGQRESQGQPSGNSAMNYSSELGPGQNQGQGNPNLQNVPQPSPNTLTMVQQQFLMQQQFEALQKMSAQAGNLQDGSPGSRPAPQQNLSPDGPASHAALIASQQQLLKAMATLHQQQQQQQQGPQSAAQGPPMLGPQSSLPMRPQLPPHMSARPQHPSLGSMQSAPQASHPHQLQMQRPPLNIQQQQQPNSQPPFPGPMFMHQRFAAAGRPPNPGMPFNQQSQPGPQIPTNFNNSQEASRPIPGKFQSDPLSPGMFLNNYPGMPRHSFPFHFPTGQGAPSQHAGSPHPIGTPPGGSGFQGPTRDEREILAGMPQLTIQPPRSMSQGQASARLNNMELPNESLMLGNPDSPHSGDGQHPLFKGNEVSADPPGRDSAQPGTYSLFSSTPWSVQISSAGDAKCQQQSLGSSPFSSQASSMRNSPDPGAEFNTGDADLISGGAGLMQADGGLGTTFNLGLGFGTGDWGLQGGDNPGRPINSNLQGHSLWSSTGISPLQRLLEQQRQHRQNDPH